MAGWMEQYCIFFILIMFSLFVLNVLKEVCSAVKIRLE